MASGTLSRQVISGISTTTVYTVPSTTVTSALIAVTNLSASASAPVKIGICSASETSISNASTIESKIEIPPSGVFERGGIVMGTTEKIIVESLNSLNNISVRIQGYEEASS